MRRKTLFILLSSAMVLFGFGAIAHAEEVLPKAQQPFKGKLDASRDKSLPDWPRRITAPAGAPNIVVVLLDDVGFGASSVTGGAVATPSLDRLASKSLIFNQFHVNAMCSPTRAALLTGRNSHQVGAGAIADSASGYPGYNSVLPRNAASIAEVLRQNGYSTAAFGKWHNTPVWEIGPAGPFDRWPTGQGFEYFYGFMGAGALQWEPSLHRGTTAVAAPAKPEQGYNLTTDLATDAIRWLHQHDAVASDKPFFLYFSAPGTHTPLQVSKEWIDKFRGQFDQGWDQLREQTYARQKKLGVIPANASISPRPAELAAWDSLSTDEKKLFSAQMEVYAAYLAQTDYEIGRVLDAIEEEGQGDNTLVLYIAGDNGASMEGGLIGSDTLTARNANSVKAQLSRADQLGGPGLVNQFAAGWAWALNTPFQWGKQQASHLGGIRDPLIVSWPAKIRDHGAIRSQFSHVIDIAPTIYEAAGIKAPDVVSGVKQVKLEGSSLLHAFENAKAPNKRNVQYFETLGNRGIYKDGWFAGRRSFLSWEEEKYAISDPDQHPWELYNLNQDFSQVHDQASQSPRKLKELVDLFDQEIRRNNGYPIAPHRTRPPSMALAKTSFTYREGAVGLPRSALPRLAGRAHRITADIEVPAQGAEGVIFAQGGRIGGYSLYVRNGKLVYESNTSGDIYEKLIASAPLPIGKVRIVLEFAPEIDHRASQAKAGPSTTRGLGRLSMNGKPADELQFTSFGSASFETFDVGSDLASPVSNDYTTPFAFTGKIDKVVIDLK